jgi:hypothetical protein
MFSPMRSVRESCIVPAVTEASRGDRMGLNKGVLTPAGLIVMGIPSSGTDGDGPRSPDAASYWWRCPPGGLSRVAPQAHRCRPGRDDRFRCSATRRPRTCRRCPVRCRAAATDRPHVVPVGASSRMVRERSGCLRSSDLDGLCDIRSARPQHVHCGASGLTRPLARIPTRFPTSAMTRLNRPHEHGAYAGSGG